MYASAFLLVASVAGCSATATTGTTTEGDTCSADPTVSGCMSGGGYSCSGSDAPNQGNPALSCGSGILGNGGLVLYCCIAAGFTPNTCAQDSTVGGCITPSIGFSCMGSAPPQQFDASLSCSAGVQSGGSLQYCCDTTGAAPMTTVCAPDGNVPCATAGTTGYTCPSGVAPDTSLNCSTGTTESNDEVSYCCGTPATTVAACAADATVSCATAGTTGYSCPSSVTPDASLDCSTGTPAAGGGMTYCCGTPATTVPACAADATVSCPTAGTTGYSCPSGASPDASLACSGGTAVANGGVTYCCGTPTTSPTMTSTCAADTTVACEMGATGYSCTGTDTPWQGTASLLCETTVVNGVTGYCCVNSGNSCLQATPITDCTQGAFGVACTGADDPMTANASLACAADPGAMGFCCTIL